MLNSDDVKIVGLKSDNINNIVESITDNLPLKMCDNRIPMKQLRNMYKYCDLLKPRVLE